MTNPSFHLQTADSLSQSHREPNYSPKSRMRRGIAWFCFAAGLLIFACGCYLETRNPRSNVEDNTAWLVLAVGVSLGAFGFSLLFVRPILASIVAVFAPFAAFALAAMIFWILLLIVAFGNRHHQAFAANGVSKIPPARQMDELFDDCRHFITYGPHGVALFNSEAYFGGRYELTMQVPVDIESKTSGSMTGEPQFYLHEISAVEISPSGQVGVSYSRGLNFGPAEWKQVYNADGDFSTIGFNVIPTPVANFKKYTDAARPSN